MYTKGGHWYTLKSEHEIIVYFSLKLSYMKKVFTLFIALTGLNMMSQMSPVAQALYNETYNHDVTRGQYAINNGAQFYGTAD